MVSATSIFTHLDPSRYDPTPIRIEKDGRWLRLDRTPNRHVGTRGACARKRCGRNAGQSLRRGVDVERGRRLSNPPRPLRRGRHDSGVARTGQCSVRGSRSPRISRRDGQVCDETPVRGARPAGEPRTSRCFDRNGRATPTPSPRVCRPNLGYPVFVKPANLGSSVGISKATSPEQVASGHDTCARFQSQGRSANHTRARGIECAVLGNDDPATSVPGGIIPTREFYDLPSRSIWMMPSVSSYPRRSHPSRRSGRFDDSRWRPSGPSIAPACAAWTSSYDAPRPVPPSSTR